MSDDFPPMIGKYKVLGIVAKGGMGVVYRAIYPAMPGMPDVLRKKLNYFLICKVPILFTCLIILQKAVTVTWLKNWLMELLWIL